MINLFRSAVVCLALIAFTSVAHFSQTTPAAPVKVGLINSFAFANENGGVTKYITAIKTLNSQFAPTQAELNSMSQKLATLAKEIETIREKASTSAVPFNPRDVQLKVDEAERIDRDLKRKQEDAKIAYDRKQQEILGPVSQEIMKSLTDYAKQRGYALIFDIAKDETGLLVAVGDERLDITKDFIAFFNAKK